jgi:hypothetical protein
MLGAMTEQKITFTALRCSFAPAPKEPQPAEPRSFHGWSALWTAAMNPMAELSMAMLTLLFAAVMLVAAVAFDRSHERQEQLRTVALFEQPVAQR